MLNNKIFTIRMVGEFHTGHLERSLVMFGYEMSSESDDFFNKDGTA